MKITKILLKNYRQFKDLDINLKMQSERNLHIFVAVMGTGKTNLLNAINWCLYGKEPYLSSDSQILPRLNLETLHSGVRNAETKVEVWTESNTNKLVFSRNESFTIAEKPISIESSFEVKQIFAEDGNAIILSASEADSYVERFVPLNIREFFFFDGERLDRYFREATAQNIKNAIFKICRVDLLDTTFEHLQRVISECRKNAGKLSPQVEIYRSQLEAKERLISAEQAKIDECIKQIQVASEHISRLEIELRGIPDIEELQDERIKLNKEKSIAEKILEQRILDKQAILFDDGKSLLLFEAINKTLEIISIKRRKKEIPPSIDKDLLNDLLKSGECICKTNLNENENARKAIVELMKTIEYSPEISNSFLSIENSLLLKKKELMRFKEKLDKITEEINLDRDRVSVLITKINQIDNKIGGFDNQRVIDWHRDLKKFEAVRSDKQEALGYARSNWDGLKKEADELQIKLDRELKKEGKAEKINKEIDFLVKAIRIIDSSKTDIMDEMRSKIEDKTREFFFDLMWKKESFKEVNIDAYFTLHLIHALGYECLGSISGGEREVLALAFTLALHDVSGFDSPMIIDRPLAMVSGKPRINIAEVLKKISLKKQIILFLTPDDYESIMETMDSERVDKFQLKLHENEKRVRMEALNAG